MFSRVARRVINPVRSVFSRNGNRTFMKKAFKFSAFTTTTATMLYFASSSNIIEAKGRLDYGEIKQAIADILDDDRHDDGSWGPFLIRLGWHTSGTYSKHDHTGGSTKATIRFSPESQHGGNAGLTIAMRKLENIKQRYPEISYGDLYTLAACVAIEEMGGPKINWRSGRVDGTQEECTPDGRLPDGAQGYRHLRDIFYRMGFDDREIVALSGAHAVGRCHTDRSGFKGPWTNAPTTFSNLYFVELLSNTWTEKQWNGPRQFEDKSGQLMMLPSDMALKADPGFRRYAEIYARDENQFFFDFSRAFKKLIELGVKFE